MTFLTFFIIFVIGVISGAEAVLIAIICGKDETK